MQVSGKMTGEVWDLALSVVLFINYPDDTYASIVSKQL